MLIIDKYLLSLPIIFVIALVCCAVIDPFIALAILSSLIKITFSLPFSFIINSLSGFIPLNLLSCGTTSLTSTAILSISLASDSLIAIEPSGCSSCPLTRLRKERPTTFLSPRSIALLFWAIKEAVMFCA